MRVAQPGAKQLVGGQQGGSDFEIRMQQDQPITRVAYRTGSWANQPGFGEIRPVAESFVANGNQNVVAAKKGYALGGIAADSGSDFLHAVQLTFMRILPNGKLDPADSYTSDWIGQPTGAVQKHNSSGELVVGLRGKRMLLVHSIGLVFASEPVNAARVPPQIAPGGGPRGRMRSPFPEMKIAPSAAKPEPAEPVEPATPPPDFPKPVREALDSLVLVEHPLGTGSGFAVAKNIVATNAHVVDGAFPDQIKVQSGGENNAPQRITRVIYVDQGEDLCLLEGEMDLKPLAVRSDYAMKAGDAVVLQGNPAVRGGIVMRNAILQGTMRTLVHLEGHDLYHIDANVNPGWSGGPGLDADGKVIAIVVMKANDATVKEIRDAMRKLDDNFRAANSGAKGGITYGIPASALARILKDKTLKDDEQRTATNDRFAAQTLVKRVNALASLALLRVQTNVPPRVRTQAASIASGRLKNVNSEHVPLMPEELARIYRMMLDSPRVKELEDQFGKDMEARIDAMLENPNVDESVKRDVKSLADRTKDATTFAQRPATTYTAYASRVGGLTRDIKRLTERLEKAVGADDKE